VIHVGVPWGEIFGRHHARPVNLCHLTGPKITANGDFSLLESWDAAVAYGRRDGPSVEPLEITGSTKPSKTLLAARFQCLAVLPRPVAVWDFPHLPRPIIETLPRKRR
jgi:hypothetical protein